MGKIIATPDGVEVTLTPDEFLKAAIFSNDMKPIGVADTVVRRVAWYFLHKFGASKAKGKTFAYGDVQVVDGKFVAVFNEVQYTPEEPGPA